jgi:hypothetical protein
MTLTVLLPGLTAILALIFAVALFDQWRERRHAFQLVWGIGMLFFGIAAACEAIAAAGGWNELLYRTWYLTGAVWTAGWLGLGTAFLLAKTRFGYAFALSLFLAGLFTFLTSLRAEYANAGIAPILYFIGAGVIALAVAVETYFSDDRWPLIAAIGVVGASLLSIVLMFTFALPAPGYKVDAGNVPVPDLFPPYLRLLTPFLNITGGFALIVGALFSAYVFMPKRRVLPYSLDPNQNGDSFLFNLLIAPVAITVNFVASLPGALRALASGRIHSRVPATILLAIGAFFPTYTDSLSRAGAPEWRALGHLLGVVFLFAGFLVSIEVFHDIRVPFTSMVLRQGRRERGPVPDRAAEPLTESAGRPAAGGSK